MCYISLLAGMKTPSSYLRLVVLVTLTVPCLQAQDGLRGVLRRPNFPAALGGSLAVADFDGDNQSDAAILVDSGWPYAWNRLHHVELHFSNRVNSEIAFESPESALRVAAWDIDHDGDVDVVIEQPFTGQRLQVWLNDGHGHFDKARIEDFRAHRTAGGERLNVPSPQSYSPAICLPLQGGSEVAMLAARLLAGRPPSPRDFQARLPDFSRTSTAFSSTYSRAPPPISSSH